MLGLWSGQTRTESAHFLWGSPGGACLYNRMKGCSQCDESLHSRTVTSRMYVCVWNSAHSKITSRHFDLLSSVLLSISRGGFQTVTSFQSCTLTSGQWATVWLTGETAAKMKCATWISLSNYFMALCTSVAFLTLIYSSVFLFDNMLLHLHKVAHLIKYSFAMFYCKSVQTINRCNMISRSSLISR